MSKDVTKNADSLFEVGFIYPLVSLIVSTVKWLNISELCKVLAARIGRKVFKDKDPEADRKYMSFGVDVYQIIKWGILIWLIWTGTYHPLWHWIIVYLLCSNLFSYFYYHVWEAGKSTMSVDRQRRRFITLLSAIAFFIVGYAYLYQQGFNAEITWPNGSANFIEALYLSIANAFTFDSFPPTSTTVRMVYASELVTTFFFFSIILSESIPRRNS
jgi:hypothetical protein